MIGIDQPKEAIAIIREVLHEEYTFKDLVQVVLKYCT